jgi:uncharacterized protein YdeI (YjbR/CyaY-like superfamily)
MGIDIATAVPVATGDDLDRWFRERDPAAREVVVAIFNKRSGRQTVTLGGLQEVALCHGWVDTQTRSIDEERYAIKFVPRRPRSHWGEGNRELARRLLAEGRITPEGLATLPPDL